MIRFLFLAFHAYRCAQKTGTHYSAIVSSYGCPEVCIFVGVGREAWRVTQRAIEEFKCS